MSIIGEEFCDLKSIVVRIRGRDFGGNGGQAIKNSGYQLAQNLILKIGALAFTIIIARMLMPELMGLYSLALATVIMFASFGDLGISAAITTFTSKMFAEDDYVSAKSYIMKLFKWKLSIVGIVSLVLLSSAYFMANVYYNKPIFYALIVGVIYFPTVALLGFLEQIFKTANDFKNPLIKEIIFQIARFAIIPITIFFLLKWQLSDGVIVAVIVFLLTFCYALSIIVLVALSKNKFKFFASKKRNLTKSEIKDLKVFIFPLAFLAFSGVAFGYVDTLMLGHYVPSSFIAYYGAAFALVGSATSIISFSLSALMPIFSRIKGKSLERLFLKSRNFIAMMSLSAGIFTYFSAWWVVKIAYGSAYLDAVPILKYFSILVAILPVSALYGSYLISQKKTKTMASLVISATIVNITFNVVGINYGLAHYGDMGGVLGAVFATIFSRILYLGGLMFFRKR